MRYGRDQKYQLLVRDTNDYREVRRYNLSPWNVYVVGSTTLAAFLLLAFLLIAYTPLRGYLPGYGNAVQRKEVNELENLVDDMTGQMEAQAVYIESLRKIVQDEATTEEDVELVGNLIDTSPVAPVPLSAEEIQLRRESALDRLGSVERGSTAIAPAPGSDEVSLAQIYLVAPVNGEISAAFNPANNHLGVDILAPQNTAIKAVREGVVFLAEFTSANGNVIGIQHDNNLISFYKHNSQLLKQVGDRVGAGEAVAIIGNTGELTSGPHLHFELWHEGAVVDPVGVLRF